jgi:cell division protein FtsB
MRKYLLIAGVALVGILGFSLFGKSGLINLYRARQEEQELKARVAELKDENQKLREEIERLTSDPKYLEKVAREELGMVKPDEVVFHLPDTPGQ